MPSHAYGRVTPPSGVASDASVFEPCRLGNAPQSASCYPASLRRCSWRGICRVSGRVLNQIPPTCVLSSRAWRTAACTSSSRGTATRQRSRDEGPLVDTTLRAPNRELAILNSWPRTAIETATHVDVGSLTCRRTWLDNWCLATRPTRTANLGPGPRESRMIDFPSEPRVHPGDLKAAANRDSPGVQPPLSIPWCASGRPHP